MPQSNQKRSTSTKTGSKSKSNQKSVNKSTTNKTQAPNPMRREIGGAVCFFLAVLGIISYFNVDAIFIRFYRDLLRGLFGAGYYWMPPALLLTSFVLVFHHGRPVVMRVVCTLLSPVVIGAFWHLVAADREFAWGFQMLPDLYVAGIAREAGGLISGFIAIALAAVISPSPRVRTRSRLRPS